MHVHVFMEQTGCIYCQWLNQPSTRWIYFQAGVTRWWMPALRDGETFVILKSKP